MSRPVQALALAIGVERLAETAAANLFLRFVVQLGLRALGSECVAPGWPGLRSKKCPEVSTRPSGLASYGLERRGSTQAVVP